MLTCGSMTRYVRSRASGYPPDLMPFSARWDGPTPAAHAQCGQLRAGRPPPFFSLEREEGKSHEVGRAALKV